MSKSPLETIVAQYDANPGEIIIDTVPDGFIFHWNGGDIARVSHAFWPQFRILEQGLGFPWDVTVLRHDKPNGVAYVRKLGRRPVPCFDADWPVKVNA